MSAVPPAAHHPPPNLTQKARTAKPCAPVSTHVATTHPDAKRSSISRTKGLSSLTLDTLPHPISP